MAGNHRFSGGRRKPMPRRRERTSAKIPVHAGISLVSAEGPMNRIVVSEPNAAASGRNGLFGSVRKARRMKSVMPAQSVQALKGKNKQPHFPYRGCTYTFARFRNDRFVRQSAPC